MWTLHSDCKDNVSSSWNTTFSGSHTFILSSKLKFLKNRLKEWYKETFGDIHMEINLVEDKLNHIQSSPDLQSPTDEFLLEEKLAQ